MNTSKFKLVLAVASTIALAACMKKGGSSELDSLSSSQGVSEAFDVRIKAIDLNNFNSRNTARFVPEREVVLEDGHSYELHIALYSRDSRQDDPLLSQQQSQGILRWTTSAQITSGQACGGILTGGLTSYMTEIPVTVCQVTEDQKYLKRDFNGAYMRGDFKLIREGNGFADSGRINFGNYNNYNNSGNKTNYNTSTGSTIRNRFIAECQPSAVARYLPNTLRDRSSQVSTANGSYCTCGGWTIAVEVFASEYYGKGKSYAQACADTLSSNTSTKVNDTATLKSRFVSECSPATVKKYMNSDKAYLANTVKFEDGVNPMCDCGDDSSISMDAFSKFSGSYAQYCASRLQDPGI